MHKISSVTVYVGSSGHARGVFYEQAYKLGKTLADKGLRLVFGGMNAGAMRSLAHGTLENGGSVTGVIPTRIKDSERVSREITELIDVETMWQRKRRMFELGDMLIMLPGGYGTLDEGLEAVYWKTLALHDKPLVFVNIENFYTPLMQFIEDCVRSGSMPKSIKDNFIFINQLKDLDFSKFTSVYSGANASVFPHFEEEIFAPTRTPLIIDEADIASVYKLMTALVTRQLGAHDRPIGLLNRHGQFDALLAWVRLAAKERFITRKCPHLMVVRKSERGLMAAMERKEQIVIDLHRDKWGD